MKLIQWYLRLLGDTGADTDGWCSKLFQYPDVYGVFFGCRCESVSVLKKKMMNTVCYSLVHYIKKDRNKRAIQKNIIKINSTTHFNFRVVRCYQFWHWLKWCHFHTMSMVTIEPIWPGFEIMSQHFAVVQFFQISSYIRNNKFICDEIKWYNFGAHTTTHKWLDHPHSHIPCVWTSFYYNPNVWKRYQNIRTWCSVCLFFMAWIRIDYIFTQTAW